MATEHELAVFATNSYRPSDENFIALDGWAFHRRLSSPLRGRRLRRPLTQIVQGVKAAQEVVAIQGAEVSPHLTGGPSVNSTHGFVPTKTGVYAQIVSFDVALTVKEGNSFKAYSVAG